MKKMTVREFITYCCEYHEYWQFVIVKNDVLFGRYYYMNNIPNDILDLSMIGGGTEDKYNHGTKYHSLIIEC